MWPKMAMKLLATSKPSSSAVLGAEAKEETQKRKKKNRRKNLDQSSVNNATLTIEGQQERGQWRGRHIPGQPLVPDDEYALLSSGMKVLRDNIMKLETDGSNTSHFTVKVPNDYNFFAEDFACKFTLEFADIFCMFNLGMLGASLVRLWALYQAKEARRNKAPILAVIDPFHFHEDNLDTDSAHREMIAEWLCNAMLIHKDKQYLLLPYSPA